MINAEEARKISRNFRNKDDDLFVLGELIEAAAKKGQTSIRVPYEMSDHKGYEQWLKADGLEDALKQLGYKVDSRSEDFQFVDLWIEVSW